MKEIRKRKMRDIYTQELRKEERGHCNDQARTWASVQVNRRDREVVQRTELRILGWK